MHTELRLLQMIFFGPPDLGYIEEVTETYNSVLSFTQHVPCWDFCLALAQLMCMAVIRSISFGFITANSSRLQNISGYVYSTVGM